MQGGGHLADDLDADEQREDEQGNGNDESRHGIPSSLLLGLLGIGSSCRGGGAAGNHQRVVKFFGEILAELAVTHEVHEDVGHIARKQVDAVVATPEAR